MVVRNPLAGFGLTILGTLGLSFLAGIPILFLPQRELTYFYFPFALFGVGVFSGRTTFLGSLGFIGGLLGGIAGGWLFQFFFLPAGWGSEEHTSELQSLAYLVCRLLLEKKKKRTSPASLVHRQPN